MYFRESVYFPTNTCKPLLSSSDSTLATIALCFWSVSFGKHEGASDPNLSNQAQADIRYQIRDEHLRDGLYTYT